MKKIKKLLFVGLFPILAFTMSSCTDYQDEIDQLDVRVTNLENLVKQANNELILKVILSFSLMAILSLSVMVLMGKCQILL